MREDAILAMKCEKRSRVRWFCDVSTFLNDDDDRARCVSMRASEFFEKFGQRPVDFRI